MYENRDDVTLTTYILQDSPELLAGKTRPAVIICPGGGSLTVQTERRFALPLLEKSKFEEMLEKGLI